MEALGWVVGAEEDSDDIQSQRVSGLKQHVELLLKEAETREAELQALKDFIDAANAEILRIVDDGVERGVARAVERGAVRAA